MMQPLVARTGEVALLSVQEANRSLTVMREESQNSLQAGGWIGRRSAMHCTASGRVLLFDADDDLVEALTADDVKAAERRAPGAPRTVDELVARLRAERRQGYACASDEIEVGLTSVGVPVRSPQGNILAALNVSGPTSRMGGRVESTAMLLRAASVAITKSLSTRSIGRLRDQW
jgi:IclR family acetate operon transcriptional repressor